MALEYDYGINIGNRFFDLTGHDEDPDAFIASKTSTEEKPKKSTKDTKQTTKKSTTKASAPTTTATSTTDAPTASARSTGAKSNKENVTLKPADTDQTQTASKPVADSNYQRPQSTRTEGGGRGGRGFRRGGGSAGRERPPYEGGDGQQRSHRYPKFGGSAPRNEANDFEQNANTWSNEMGNDNQASGGTYNRGRGRFRGGGRGRGRGGRGYFHNRPHEEASQGEQQQQSLTTSGFDQNVEANFDNTQPPSTPSAVQNFEADTSVAQDQQIQPDGARRGRGHYRPRVFRNSRNYPGEHEIQDDGQRENFRRFRRQHDRQPRSFNASIKPVEKKGGDGANNWGNVTENPEEVEPTAEPTEATEQPATDAPAPASKDWAKQVDEAEEMMTLDEYKKKKEAQKMAHQEKLPQFNRRAPNEGEDLKKWQAFDNKYQKNNEGDVSGEDEEEEGSDEEANADEDEHTGKKKIINIPLHFTRIDRPRGFGDSRGGQRRGGGGGGRFRDQPRSKSPNQQEPYSQEAGEYHSDQQQQQQQQYQRPYRGGSRPGYGRGEYRRSYGNSARGSRGGFNRQYTDSNTPDFANVKDFPTLHDSRK